MGKWYEIFRDIWGKHNLPDQATVTRFETLVQDCRYGCGTSKAPEFIEAVKALGVEKANGKWAWPPGPPDIAEKIRFLRMQSTAPQSKTPEADKSLAEYLDEVRACQDLDKRWGIICTAKVGAIVLKDACDANGLQYLEWNSKHPKWQERVEQWQ